MELFGIIFQFFDMLVSAFISAYNIIRDLWRELLGGVAILIAAIIALRILRAMHRRSVFLKKLRTGAKENGIKLKYNRSPMLSLFWNLAGYDIELDVRGVHYRLKFYPFITRGRAVHLDGARDTYYQGRLAHRRAVNSGRVGGIKIPLDYDTTPTDGVVNILVFSPDPLAVTERNEGGTVWELDTENGGDFDGVYLFSASVLGSRLPRLMDGYIDELRHIDEV